MTAPVDWAARLTAAASWLREVGAAPMVGSDPWLLDGDYFNHVEEDGEFSWKVVDGRGQAVAVGEVENEGRLIALWGPDMAGWVADALEAEALRAGALRALGLVLPAQWAMSIADRILGDRA